jgi:UDP-GlcNAc:undecaprenyl-phosphate/decaprenyl-phosphate GlcNAc-1-phosphate transferase
VITSLLIAFCGVVTTIYLLDQIAVPIKLQDAPEGRKQHRSSTSLVGGIAMVAGVLTLAFTNTGLFGDEKIVLASMVVLMSVGVLDDIRDMSVYPRMMVQLGSACAIFYLQDLRFLSLGDLLGFGDIGLGQLALVFTCIAIVGGINAVNMIDGLDGLCGVLSSIAFSGIVILSYSSGQTDILMLSGLMLTSTLGYLLYNFRFPWNKRARVFMGDSGSYVLGFMIVVMFLKVTQEESAVVAPVTALWLLALPLLDCARLLLFRAGRGGSPLSDDREHIHYLLVDRGMSVEKTVNLLCLSSAVVALVGLALHFMQVSEKVSFVLFLLLIIGYFYVVRRIRALPAEG